VVLGVLGAAVLGAAVLGAVELPVVPATAVLPAAPLVPVVALAEPVLEEAGAAALALAGALGSSLLGVALVPLIEAANAVTCVRTSSSFVRVDSSSVIEAPALLPVVVFGAVAVDPDVPAGEGVLAPVVLFPPSSSVRMRSTAATSVLQFPRAVVALLRGAVEPAAAPWPADCSSVFRCRFSSATRVLAVPVSEAAGISASADCA